MGNLLKVHRDRDRLLQLLVFNEEFLVDVVHQTASITSLPFVHTARRSYRLNAQVSHSDCDHVGFRFWLWKVLRTLSFRGRRSRNKVSVGEPAEGSLKIIQPTLWIVFEGTSASFLDAFVSSPSHTHPINLRVWSLLFLSPLFVQKKEERKNDNRNNSQQWMSWLSQRWRTQRNAIRSVICTIREPSNLWTHIALEASAKSMPAWASVCLLTSPLLYKGTSVDLGVRSLSCI